MFNKIKYWFKSHLNKILNSISFYPAVIGLLFLVLAILMMGFDFSLQGKQFKSQIDWLNIKDATTARSIISAIAAGIISLAVFSFSMVMIILNQAASQMSNRVLDKLIGNRFQQIVLGIYIGTIVYAFFLLSTIRDIDSGLYIPSLSTYLLILITIFDIFLFIYFLHYITQSVKYDVIIKKVFDNTYDVMKDDCTVKEHTSVTIKFAQKFEIKTLQAGIYEGFDKNSLLHICEKHNCMVNILRAPGSSLLKNIVIANVDVDLDQEIKKDIADCFFLHKSESIEENYFYGFRQLTEIALKALSPGINDPATAIISLRSLFELYSFQIVNFSKLLFTNKNGEAKILLKGLSFDDIFIETIIPIWNYGKNDRMIQKELLSLLPQLLSISENEKVTQFLNVVKEKAKENIF
ncbi:hypothetical protein A5893_09860 [Pedobacter psychrophilus]|uniref:DUF2254 domain-containing protein n=1 Tax=Pedobacter psychrophilus TaxID=1826909 RepID=A0A179DG51_9SPHI|nr:DUF2254 family protein [Pedobacter psychrophilus]OAQ39864.1 hypothetical protein A5893_09860 [Pedobacter psychrophilus]